MEWQRYEFQAPPVTVSRPSETVTVRWYEQTAPTACELQTVAPST